jgi:hypothetical protein
MNHPVTHQHNCPCGHQLDVLGGQFVLGASGIADARINLLRTVIGCARSLAAGESSTGHPLTALAASHTPFSDLVCVFFRLGSVFLADVTWCHVLAQKAFRPASKIGQKKSPAFPNPWREEFAVCSGGACRRVWKQLSLCLPLNATASTCDNLVWLPLGCRFYCAEVRGQLLPPPARWPSEAHRICSFASTGTSFWRISKKTYQRIAHAPSDPMRRECSAARGTVGCSV